MRVKDEQRKYRCRRCDERFYEDAKCQAPTFGVKPADRPAIDNISPYDMNSNPASLEELFEKAQEKDNYEGIRNTPKT